MIISVATPSRYTTLTPTAVDLRKTGKGILAHPYKREAKGPSTTDQTNTIREGACQAEAVVMADTHTHISLRTACTAVAKPAIAEKTAPYSSNPKEKWSKTPSNLHTNHRSREVNHTM
jgi:hypothetical protein